VVDQRRATAPNWLVAVLVAVIVALSVIAFLAAAGT